MNLSSQMAGLGPELMRKLARKWGRHVMLVSLLLLSLMWNGSVLAHGNDDHEHAAPVANQTAVAPRATAQSEDFELVAVLQAKRLMIYLDRFATNEAIKGAQVEVESAGLFKLKAKENEAGVYILDLSTLGDKAPSAVGKYALTFTIDSDETSDVLAASLEIAADDSEAHDHDEGRPRWQIILGIASLVSAGIVFIVLWSRRKSAFARAAQGDFV